MAAVDTAFAPSFLSRLAAPIRKMQRSALRKRGPLDAALDDFLAEAAHPGDKVLQLGHSGGISAAFLDRGVYLNLVASSGAADLVEAICQLRGCSSARLRLFENVGSSGNVGEVDAVWLSRTSSLAVLAAHYRHAEHRIRTGGSLYLDGLDTEHGKALFKQMQNDEAWRLDEVISGDVAVFRRALVLETV
ncbi:hypothetical protein V0U79_13155 [Hyphobacterium sp. HN65]|uniref:SAM-dependent methyltransferase n=1 Tax=Hyphobacterium lacteum TaxID=3116575 RepID=A0ABU7LTT9_9PROT|nr:hypothetical protein [Hyphobacterium sp. HN65]MEE2527308.1 hypothetical protein [Hyphobacterium sp. HN65]